MELSIDIVGCYILYICTKLRFPDRDIETAMNDSPEFVKMLASLYDHCLLQRNATNKGNKQRNKLSLIKLHITLCFV